MLSLLGSTFALVMGGLAWLVMRSAKRSTDKAKQGNLYRIAAWMVFVGSCSLIGSQFQHFATGIVSHLPAGLVVLAGVVCGGIFFADTIGKTNYAGKKTVIIAAIAPMLLINVPTLFGLDPAQLVREVKSVTTDAGIIQTSARN